jgi:sucrose synthase
MDKLFQAVLHSDEKTTLWHLINHFVTEGKQYVLRNEILQTFADQCQRFPELPHHPGSAVGTLIYYTHEMILEPSGTWFVMRPWIASQEVWWLAADLADYQKMTPQALLHMRDRQVNRDQPQILAIDLHPFYQDGPKIDDPRNIGNGLAFLNHYLCDRILQAPQHWLEEFFQVLRRHQYDGISLLINERIPTSGDLSHQVRQALKFLSEQPAATPYETLQAELHALGFDPGWGNTVGRVGEMLELLNRLIDTPEPAILAAFVARVPAIFRVVLISIHGWVGQESVLGRPETRSQVAYVLEQARSLEIQLRQELELAGLTHLGIHPQVLILTRLIPNCEGTACALPLEKIANTEYGWILRVPFREFNPNVTQNWLAKSEIWPYLESFALDAEPALLKHLQGQPNLIIGNYSDGNLVAFLLARRFDTIQCNIAHSLEKPKYLFSNLYWQDLEAQYHFSAQFTADLISMNAADFIITATNQEIVGTPDTFGQYESYKCFTMPQLYHVVDGIDLFSPKFNRIPPGVDEQIFFPFTQMVNRDAITRDRTQDLLFSRTGDRMIGTLKDPHKRPILAIAPISLSKNLPSLIACFGQSPELQARCNLILLTNKIQITEAINAEESQEIAKIHALIAQYSLAGHIRWLGLRLPTHDLGEVYRVIADRQGIFVQYSQFETLGRTILEAMISGLPTFATQFGGASEIIQDGTNGFHINPTDPVGTAQKIWQFLDQCAADPHQWQAISAQASQHIHDQYNWLHHTQRLLVLAKIYSFWSYVSHNPRAALLQHLDVLFHLIYKPRANQILEEHKQR